MNTPNMKTSHNPPARRLFRRSLLVLATAGLTQSSFGIVHPGMLHTEATFTRMRTKVTAAAQPWKGSWDLLVASANSQNTLDPRAVATINRGTSPALWSASHVSRSA
jgi:hypothetical protein